MFDDLYRYDYNIILFTYNIACINAIDWHFFEGTVHIISVCESWIQKLVFKLKHGNRILNHTIYLVNYIRKLLMFVVCERYTFK